MSSENGTRTYSGIDHYQFTDDEFEIMFSSCRLEPSLFNHEAHLRLAWIHLNKYGLEESIVTIPDQLRRYVAHLGASDKYHHTLTIAAIYTVAHFNSRTSSRTFPALMEEFPQLKNDFKTLIGSHYSFDIFNSAEARNRFIQPDLAPF